MLCTIVFLFLLTHVGTTPRLMKRERVRLAERSRGAAGARTNDATGDAVDVALGERPDKVCFASGTRRIVHGRRYGVPAAQVTAPGFTILLRLLKRVPRARGGVAADKGKTHAVILSPSQLCAASHVRCVADFGAHKRARVGHRQVVVSSEIASLLKGFVLQRAGALVLGLLRLGAERDAVRSRRRVRRRRGWVSRRRRRRRGWVSRRRRPRRRCVRSRIIGG